MHGVLPQVRNHRDEPKRQASSPLHVQRPAALTQQRKVQVIHTKSWRKAVARLQPKREKSCYRRRLQILRTDAMEEKAEDKTSMTPYRHALRGLPDDM